MLIPRPTTEQPLQPHIAFTWLFLYVSRHPIKTELLEGERPHSLASQLTDR